MIMRFILLALISILCSCSVLVGRDLPIKKAPQVSKKRDLIVSSPNLSHMMPVSDLKQFFESTQLFNSVQILDSYKNPSKENPDKGIEIELNFISTGFFEPYCLVFLTIIPCTPPLKWTLAAKVVDDKNKLEKKYLLKEDAVMVTWAFGFLLSGSGKSSDHEDDLKRNMLLNLLNKMKADSIFK